MRTVVSYLRSQPHLLAKRRIARVCAGRVLSGPFAGLRYGGGAFMSAGTPKLAGTYEMELFPAFERLLAARPSLVADAGAAEGFYAAAFAWRLPAARIVAFEIEEKNHPAIRALAEANGVSDRLEIRGACDHNALAELGRVCPRDAALLMDVEGAEFDMLTPETASLLAGWRVIVEIHPWARPAGAEAVKEAFLRTHDIAVIQARERTRRDLPRPLRHALLNRWTLRELREFRPPGMFWLEMTPKTL